MGTKKTESTQTQQSTGSTRTGEVSSQEQRLQELLSGLAGQTAGQFGDISDITAGNIFDIPPEAMQYIQEAFGQQAQQERRGAESDFKDIMLKNQDYLAKRGIQDSSIENTEVGRRGSEFQRTLADIEGRRAGGVASAQLQLPFQLAQTRLKGQGVAGNMFSSFANPMLDAFLRTRLSNTNTTGTASGTGTEETSGFTIGELAGLANLIPRP